MNHFLPSLEAFATGQNTAAIPENRKKKLGPLIAYIRAKTARGQAACINFICTHNSRRSQLAQVWAQTAAACYGIEARCFSGGVEVTAFNGRAVYALERAGCRIEKEGGENPVYRVFFSEKEAPVKAFSKRYDDPGNPSGNFAAVMTCSHADENCPYIPGAEVRISVPYDDPKDFDGTPGEEEAYNRRSVQIASEMFYVFSNIRINKWVPPKN